MKNKISKSFLKASQTYWMLSQFVKVNEESLSERELKIFESMNGRMLENIKTLKFYKDNEAQINKNENINDDLISINSYSEAVLQKLNFYLK